MERPRGEGEVPPQDCCALGPTTPGAGAGSGTRKKGERRGRRTQGNVAGWTGERKGPGEEKRKKQRNPVLAGTVKYLGEDVAVA